MTKGLSSMTGFAAAEGENGRYKVRVEIRTVNHRNLDLVLRLRDPCRASERLLRSLLRERLHRGRVEVSVQVEGLLESAGSVHLERSLAREVVELIEALRSEGLPVAPVGPGDLLRVPGLLEVRKAEEEWTAEDDALLLSVAEDALERLQEERRREGVALATAIQSGLQEVEARVRQLAERRGRVVSSLHAGLTERLSKLLGEPALDPQRVAQEAAILADRSDVQEELDRVCAHIALGQQIPSEEPPHGKRLDFLFQEILRELNTLGAKCRDLEMSQVVLEAKTLSEQMREQVQNVE